MRRSVFILTALLIASVALAYATYRLAGRVCAAQLVHGMDDLDWLRMEFRLGEAEMARIRQLHEGYLPTCRSHCERIAVKKRDLAGALRARPEVTPAVEQTVAEIAALRARCQTAMLRHFIEVSRVMPPEQGHRYLAEMERLTLGSHEQIERSMSGHMPAPHGKP
jgi:hypothetical protein